MTFPKTKKNPKIPYLYEIQNPGGRPLKKKSKRNVNDVPKDKQKIKITLPQLTFIAQAEIEFQAGVP